MSLEVQTRQTNGFKTRSRNQKIPKTSLMYDTSDHQDTMKSSMTVSKEKKNPANSKSETVAELRNITSLTTTTGDMSQTSQKKI